MLSERFEQALVYATQLHRGQIRKGSGIDYVAHLIGVASLALEYGANEDQAIAALLHDAVEDQGGVSTQDEIRRRFGETVCQIVTGCSETLGPPKPNWHVRKRAYLDQLREASPAVRLVSAADKLNNARSLLLDYRRLGEPLWARFTGGKEGTLWFYRAMVEEYRTRGPEELAEELARTLDTLESLFPGA